MRAIDNKHLRRAASLDAINASNTAIATVAEAGRDAFIVDHQEDWRGLRTGLWAVGCMKCWYSEASLQQGEGHVELVCSPKLVPSDMRVFNRPFGPEGTLDEKQEAHPGTDHSQAA